MTVKLALPIKCTLLVAKYFGCEIFELILRAQAPVIIVYKPGQELIHGVGPLSFCAPFTRRLLSLIGSLSFQSRPFHSYQSHFSNEINLQFYCFWNLKIIKWFTMEQFNYITWMVTIYFHFHILLWGKES